MQSVHCSAEGGALWRSDLQESGFRNRMERQTSDVYPGLTDLTERRWSAKAQCAQCCATACTALLSDEPKACQSEHWSRSVRLKFRCTEVGGVRSHADKLRHLCSIRRRSHTSAPELYTTDGISMSLVRSWSFVDTCCAFRLSNGNNAAADIGQPLGVSSSRRCRPKEGSKSRTCIDAYDVHTCATAPGSPRSAAPRHIVTTVY